MVAPLIPDVGPKLEAELQQILVDVRGLVAERDALAKRVVGGKRAGWIEAANFLETLGDFAHARMLRCEVGMADDV